VPALPYIFDHPIERATDVIFEWIEERIAGVQDKEKEKKTEL
jgi:fission process protein 1